MLEVAYGVLGLGLVAYALTGGADFGAGFWHLVARGKTKDEERRAIDHALGPLWEANHVWLIFVIVVMFSAFPRAFAVLGVAFHVPIVLALLGIVGRGASFVFRTYGVGPAAAPERYGRAFALFSTTTPIFLGLVLAGMSAGHVVVAEGRVTSPWLTPFGVTTGFFALSLFALLAATYLAAAAGADATLRSTFRRRALVCEGVAGILAFVAYRTALADAPRFGARLGAAPLFWPLQALTALAAVLATTLLLRDKVHLARLFVAAQVALVVLGWGAAMRGDLVLGLVGIHDAGARPATLAAVLPILAGGSLLLAPALFLLFRLFASRHGEPPHA